MKISTMAATLLAALLASAAVQAASSESEQEAGQSQQEQNDDASAHGYQTPTGEDPDPRMTDHPNSEPEITDEDETMDDENVIAD
jgi:opacity protein-like surface antigen